MTNQKETKTKEAAKRLASGATNCYTQKELKDRSEKYMMAGALIGLKSKKILFELYNTAKTDDEKFILEKLFGV